MKYILKHKIIFFSLCFFQAGCAIPATKSSDTISITLMDPFEFPENSYSMATEIYDTTLHQWEEEHPEIDLQERHLKSSDYYIELASYATIDRGFSDIYVIPAGIMPYWQRQNLIYDVTDEILDSTYYDSCQPDLLQPFMENDHIYGFPMTNQSYTIVVYDKNVWASIGYDEFPDNWEDIINANETIHKKGYDCTIGFSNANTSNAITQLLSSLAINYCGEKWFDDLIDKDSDAMFTDDNFILALKDMKKICDSGIFPKDYNAGNNAGALNCFLNGQCPAAILNSDSLYELQQRMKSSDSARYDQLGFAFLPQSYHAQTDKSKSHYVSQRNIAYALVINAKVAEDPRKLKACIEFCEFMTGKPYANNMTERFGFPSFTISDTDYEGDDTTWIRMLNLLSEADADPKRLFYKNPESYMGNGVWASANAEITSWLNGVDYTPGEIANLIQDGYEKYYLPQDLMYYEYVVY